MRFGDPAIVRARAEAGAELNVESPAPGPSNESFVVSGTAVDLDASSVHGHRYRSCVGVSQSWLGRSCAVSRSGRLRRAATRHRDRLRCEVQERRVLARRNVGAWSWLLVAYGHSTVSQTFAVHETAAITVRAGQAEIHFETPLGPVVYSAFEITRMGARRRRGNRGRLRRHPRVGLSESGSGAAPVFCARPAALGRPDIANTHGLQFLLSGFVIRTSPRLLELSCRGLRRSTVTNRFDVHESRMLEVREATEAVLQVNAPANGAVVGETVGVTGHAFDPR